MFAKENDVRLRIDSSKSVIYDWKNPNQSVEQRELMHTQRVIQAAALLLLAAVCHAQQAAPKPNGFSFTKVDLDLLDESNQLDKQLQDQGLVYNDRETTEYLTEVGQRVLPKGPELQNVQWRFLVLRDPSPNAFALPNGSIYVHSGLLGLIQNEAQLAGVLGHEETHVSERHTYLENRISRKEIGATTILATEASWTSAFLLLMTRSTSPSLARWIINGYSSKTEQEADLRSIHALVEANYSAPEMTKLFDALQESYDVDLPRRTFYENNLKLKERSHYVGSLAESSQPSQASTTVGTDGYLKETENAVRQDIDLEILAGRVRTAVWMAKQLAKRDDKAADNFLVLAEAYRGLGPRTPEPTREELKGKEEARKRRSAMTPQEYEAALLKAPGGRQALESNDQLAEKYYMKAIEISPNLAGPHKGLGLLYEEEKKPQQSAAELRKYLELAPSAVDSPQIRRRLALTDNKVAN